MKALIIQPPPSKKIDWDRVHTQFDTIINLPFTLIMCRPFFWKVLIAYFIMIYIKPLGGV